MVLMWAVLCPFLALVTFGVYGSLRSFEVVGPARLTVFRIPTPRLYPYTQVRSVEFDPNSPAVWSREYGCTVTFSDRSVLTFSTDNGLREEDVVRIGTHIADRAGVATTTRRKPRP
jgi:hypothetical protein